MRQFAGFGSPEDTNARFKYLLAHGQTGLSTAFDLPTLMGRDADDPWSEGEVGICGVAISSLKDMEKLFSGIPLGDVSTSMTINSPAAMIFAYYLCVADKQGVPYSKLRGTLQNDILKEYIAQKEFIYPPEPSMRIIVDMIEFCTKEVPGSRIEYDLWECANRTIRSLGHSRQSRARLHGELASSGPVVISSASWSAESRRCGTESPGAPRPSHPATC